jgi:LacI family transcriptional regulator
VTTSADVARAAGVSVQTVSVVINGKSGISEATRERVLRAIQELDYHPNQLASSLRSRRTRTIGILVPSITNPYWPEMVRGAEDVAHRNDYAVFLCNTDGDPTKEQGYIRLLRRHRVAGFFTTIGGHASDIEALVATGIPVARAGVTQVHEKIVALNVDDRRGEYDATAHLLSLGHRRIGIIVPLSGPGAGRRAGYADALRERGIAVDPELMVPAEFDIPSGQTGAGRLLALPYPPTAIVAGNDLIAIGVITTLKRHGKRIPEDVAVVGFDNIPMASFYDPPITTIAQPLYEMGAFAMQAILERIGNPALPGTAVIFDTPLIVRRSTVATAVEEEEPQPGAAPGTRTPGAGARQHPARYEEVRMI